MNPYQLAMYKKALYGLKAFDPIERNKLDEEEKRSISYQNDRAWRILNEWKQELTTKFIEQTFFRFFPKAPRTSTLDILIKPVKVKDFRIDLSFKDMGVNDNQIAKKLLSAGVLPKEFETA